MSLFGAGTGRVFSHGQIAMDSGTLVDVTDLSHTLDNGGKVVPTKGGWGVVKKAVPESEVSFSSMISEDGPERNYWRLAQKGTIKKIRIKHSGQTFEFTGIFVSVKSDAPLDDADKVDCTFKGVLSPQ